MVHMIFSESPDQRVLIPRLIFELNYSVYGQPLRPLIHTQVVSSTCNYTHGIRSIVLQISRLCERVYCPSLLTS